MVDAAIDDVVLYIPAGTYEVDQTEAMTIGNSNLVIRGAGHTTILKRMSPATWENGGGHCGAAPGFGAASIAAVCNPTYRAAAITDWESGYTDGDTVIGVTSAADFTVGGWAWLDMTATTDCAYMDTGNNNGPIFSHIDKVEARDLVSTPNTITLERGLRMDYDGLDCLGWTAQPYDPVENVGLEDIRFTNVTRPTNARWFVHFLGAVNSWVVGTQMDNSYNRWMSMQLSARIWIQGNDFLDLDKSITHNTEGISTRHGAADIVYENNTCSVSMVCQKTEKGAEGIVIGYNYTDQDIGVDEISLFNHGHYTREVLMEGNDVNLAIFMNDKWWGRNGPRNTLYRNRNRASYCKIYGVDNEGWSMAIDAQPRVSTDAWVAGSYLNVIGNTAGEFTTRPVPNNPICPPSRGAFSSTHGLSHLTDRIWLENNAWRSPSGIFQVGVFNTPYAGVNNYSCGEEENDTCPGTNKNVVAPDSSWNGDYPTSLYRTEVPSWWCEEACEWTQEGIGAFGDDFGGELCKLRGFILVGVVGMLVLGLR
jgi:hypothetical protein